MLPNSFLRWLYRLPLHQCVLRPHQTQLCRFRFLKPFCWYLIVTVICISQVIDGVKHLFVGRLGSLLALGSLSQAFHLFFLWDVSLFCGSEEFFVTGCNPLLGLCFARLLLLWGLPVLSLNGVDQGAQVLNVHEVQIICHFLHRHFMPYLKRYSPMLSAERFILYFSHRSISPSGIDFCMHW